jgi:hypothetical protein
MTGFVIRDWLALDDEPVRSVLALEAIRRLSAAKWHRKEARFLWPTERRSSCRFHPDSADRCGRRVTPAAAFIRGAIMADYIPHQEPKSGVSQEPFSPKATVDVAAGPGDTIVLEPKPVPGPKVTPTKGSASFRRSIGALPKHDKTPDDLAPRTGSEAFAKSVGGNPMPLVDHKGRTIA